MLDPDPTHNNALSVSFEDIRIRLRDLKDDADKIRAVGTNIIARAVTLRNSLTNLSSLLELACDRYLLMIVSAPEETATLFTLADPTGAETSGNHARPSGSGRPEVDQADPAHPAAS